MKVTTLGIDLAKSIFRLHGVDARGAVVLRKQTYPQASAPVSGAARTLFGGDGSLWGAHYWAREIAKIVTPRG
jgi:transposase